MDSNRFPTHIYPRQFQVYIEHLNKIHGYDINLSSLAFLSACATSIGNSVKLDNGQYTSKAILWCVVVADSGSKKSHLMEEPFEYIFNIDAEEQRKHKDSLKNLTQDERPQTPPTTILKNVTIEAMFRAHSDNPKGVIFFKDEIKGMVTGFDRYTKGGGDRQEWLELFNGKSLRIDRATKDLIFIPESCINVIGGIQSDQIGIILNENSISDGFYFRFLFATQCERKPHKFPFEPINQALKSQFNYIIESICNIENEVLTVGKETIQIYAVWHDEAQVKYFNDPFGRALQSKMETYVWRFCIILDVLDQVSNDKRRTEITPETMKNAITLAEYFRKESTEIYLESFRECVLEGEPVAFQRLYRKLDNGEHSTADLIQKFSSVWNSDNIRKKLAVKELFTRTRHGFYIKTIRDVTK